MERSIKNSKTSTTEGQPTGSGARKASVAEPEEVMMIKKNLDAAISGIHDKKNTTGRHGRSQEDNTTIQGFRHVTGKVI
jgi:hypothetical protein